MVYLLIAGYPLVLVGVVLLIRSQRKREDQLLNRIQAPERAVQQSLAGVRREEPLYVNPDNDEAWWKATERTP